MLKFDRPYSLKELFDIASASLTDTLSTLGALGALPALALSGDSSVVIEGLAAADEAEAGALSFAIGDKYLQRAREAGAVAFIVPPALASSGDFPAIVCPEPRLIFAVLLEKLATHKTQPPAVVGAVFAERASLTLGESVTIADMAYIGRNVSIGSNSVISSMACIEDGVTIGSDCLIHPRAVLRQGTRIGDRVQIHCGAVIGDDGFGYTQLPDMKAGRLIHYKNAHMGGVLIEDDVEIGANSAIDRGLVADTIIGRGTKIDNLVQIGHNCRIGRDCVIVSQVGIGGHTVLGDRVFLLGQVGLGPGVNIGADAILTGQSGLGSGAIPPGRAPWSGTPVRSQKEHLATTALSHSQLPRLRAFFQFLKKADSFQALKEAFFASENEGKKS